MGGSLGGSDSTPALDSPEHVALKLMDLIARVEGVSFKANDSIATREWILKTYTECLKTIRGKGPFWVV